MKCLKEIFKNDITNLRGASSMIGKVQRDSNIKEAKESINKTLKGVSKLWKK